MENLKKVLKLTAGLVTGAVENERNVRLTFQYHRENMPCDGADVVIYRREEPGYIFDCDEEEYFDGLQPDESDVIYQGPIEVQSTFCEYVDTTAEAGKVYAYWVGKECVGKAIAGPVAIKVRDGRVWWHYDEVLERTEQIAKDFGGVELKTVGETVLRKPLVSLRVGNPDNLIALVGGVHAGESGPEILVPAVRKIIEEHSELLADTGIVLLPSVNADMREIMADGAPWYIRKNAGGVDLNRNFDADWDYVDHSYGLSSIDPKSFTYRGPCPNSEPEVRALISLMEEVKPKAVFSYHALCSVTADNGVSSGAAKNDADYLARLRELTVIYSDAFRGEIGAPARENYDTPMICTSGSLITWLYKRGIPAFDMEMSKDIDSLTPTMRDKSTKEMIDLATEGHTKAIIEILNHFAK